MIKGRSCHSFAPILPVSAHLPQDKTKIPSKAPDSLLYTLSHTFHLICSAFLGSRPSSPTDLNPQSRHDPTPGCLLLQHRIWGPLPRLSPCLTPHFLKLHRCYSLIEAWPHLSSLYWWNCNTLTGTLPVLSACFIFLYWIYPFQTCL